VDIDVFIFRKLFQGDQYGKKAVRIADAGFFQHRFTECVIRTGFSKQVARLQYFFELFEIRSLRIRRVYIVVLRKTFQPAPSLLDN